MDLGFNLAQSNRDLKDLTSRQIFGDTSGLLCKNDLIPCRISLYLCLCLCLCFQLSFWEVVGNWLGSRSNLQRRTLRSQDFERGPIKRNCLLQTICFNEMSIQLFPRYKKKCSAIEATRMTANKTPNARSKQSDSFSLRLFRPISPMQSRPDYKIDTTIDCMIQFTFH